MNIAEMINTFHFISFHFFFFHFSSLHNAKVVETQFYVSLLLVMHTVGVSDGKSPFDKL